MSDEKSAPNGPASPPVTEMAQIALDIKEDGKKSSSSENGACGGAAGGAATAAAAADKLASPSGNGNFKEQFKAFSKFGDIKSDGKQITLSQSDKWMKQAKVIDKKITTVDTGIHFKKLKSMKVNHDDYCKFLEDLANTKKVELAEIRNKMANCGAPGVLQITPGKAASTVERLTDVKKYTGSHKERFDTQSGKGKGISGRKDVVDGSGYVSGYQHKNTYDKTH